MLLSEIPLIDVVEEKLIRDSRKSFKAFVSYMTPNYEWGWFNEYLCYELEVFFQDFLDKKNPRLMIFAPPRSGKSELASRKFPAWLLGMMSSLNIMSVSHSLALAARMSRDVRRVMEDPKYKKVFPNSILPSKENRPSESIKSTTEYWEIMDKEGRRHGTGGAYQTSGIGGGISGMGYEIGIIDDPVKDYKDASSKTKQTTNLEWYDTTFHTRRNLKINGIIVIQTRWHIKDLSGELLTRMKEDCGEKFKVLSFPMEATKDEYITVEGKKYLSRKKGGILFPERMSREFVESCKTNPLTWNALYQQNPTIAGGNFFKAEHWAFYTPESLAGVRWRRKIITADTAQKKGTNNDFTVFQVWGYDGTRIYLLHQIRKKLFSYELKKEAELIWQEYGGGIKGSIINADCFFIEDKVSGTGLIQELRNEGLPCVPIQRFTDKAVRAIDSHSYFYSGLVVLPSAMGTPWLTEYLMEFEEFSLNFNHSYDDQIDATLDAVAILLKNEGGFNYTGF